MKKRTKRVADADGLERCPTCNAKRGELPGVFRSPFLDRLVGRPAGMLCWDAFHGGQGPVPDGKA
jgi:hypothetical protein